VRLRHGTNDRSSTVPHWRRCGARRIGGNGKSLICDDRRGDSCGSSRSDIGAIVHVVFLMEENRFFDRYFGSYKGVAGFNDHPAASLGAFAQPYAANTDRQPHGVQLPFPQGLPAHLSARLRP